MGPRQPRRPGGRAGRRGRRAGREPGAQAPETTRYAKQQLNFWRDLAWHKTINHARDWLALSMATDERRPRKGFLDEVSESTSAGCT